MPIADKADLDPVSSTCFIYPHEERFEMRLYQHAIVKQALQRSTLVSLPTGTGKTLIAATVVYNFLRWFPDRICIFMATTRCLVQQQLRACCRIVGLSPDEDAQLMTGEESPIARKAKWMTSAARLIFCTPQVLRNDLRSGVCDARRIICIVFDEAHHATSSRTPYARVARLVREARAECRVLALSATAGATVCQASAVPWHCSVEDICSTIPPSHHPPCQLTS